ncbi:hypothetical protein [Acidianus bottle-shaped virus 3 strain ABV3]|uniref:Uncharacterized protein n=1 Tax=Acidianus bottle-shaped virus 3 strain ABV3 TaxID=1732174 RepID=A0A0N9P4L3_9VIRU|nr:hypothetical protein AVU00_gp54 [Acidianus bottle-shaped virus 3 strain ABV3]ALG96856.1 hypothetical protein [Acidianus bottle-shaped virus 3 strain ABV3]
MARHHKKSKADLVQVTPDATLHYVEGILTGAQDYISGILEGASLYNSWVEVEQGLEGKRIGEYKPDALRNFLENLKKVNPTLYNQAMANPTEFVKANLPEIVKNTNYQRLANTDAIMIEAGRQYRDMYPSLLKSKNVQSGMAFLQNYAPMGAVSMAKLNDILKSAVKVE